MVDVLLANSLSGACSAIRSGTWFSDTRCASVSYGSVTTLVKMLQAITYKPAFYFLNNVLNNVVIVIVWTVHEK